MMTRHMTDGTPGNARVQAHEVLLSRFDRVDLAPDDQARLTTIDELEPIDGQPAPDADRFAFAVAEEETSLPAGGTSTRREITGIVERDGPDDPFSIRLH